MIRLMITRSSSWTAQESAVILAVAVVALLLLITLIEQKKHPSLSHFFVTLAPWLMIFGVVLLPFVGVMRHFAMAWYPFGCLCLAMGLIYSVRCLSLPTMISRFLGLISSLILAEMIAILFFVPLGSAFYFYWLFAPTIWCNLITITTLLVWTLAATKLYKPPIDPKLFKSFQCTDCDHVLTSRTPVFVCPVCGGQLAGPSSDAHASPKFQSTPE